MTINSYLLEQVNNNALPDINLANNTLDDADFQRLVNALQGNFNPDPGLESDDEFDDESDYSDDESELTLSDTNVLSLALGHTTMNAASALALVGALPTKPNLRSLTVQHNQLGVAGIGHVIGYASTSSCLVQLDLSANKQEDTEAGFVAIAVADMLKSDTALSDFEFGFNHLGNTGARLIFQALRFNTHLEHINLGSNGIGDESVADLVTLIQANTPLKSMFLAGNNFSSNAVDRILEALEHNRNLTVLSLLHNPGVDQARLTRLDNLLQGNGSGFSFSEFSNEMRITSPRTGAALAQASPPQIVFGSPSFSANPSSLGKGSFEFGRKTEGHVSPYDYPRDFVSSESSGLTHFRSAAAAAGLAFPDSSSSPYSADAKAVADSSSSVPTRPFDEDDPDILRAMSGFKVGYPDDQMLSSVLPVAFDVRDPVFSAIVIALRKEEYLNKEEYPFSQSYLAFLCQQSPDYNETVASLLNNRHTNFDQQIAVLGPIIMRQLQLQGINMVIESVAVFESQKIYKQQTYTLNNGHLESTELIAEIKEHSPFHQLHQQTGYVPMDRAPDGTINVRFYYRSES